ncbi:zinc-binding dehydrogenase [Streptosporangium roseum]|uniref:NADPH:quinone reductase and related Zn-dependent oxidoreductase-like protein n=1 Tax=Streptosporangium roseum (strain ATCC 12428 / DSM 43021 / JCM 3005 / KCTC 9067 / NCIMB 10171 / NRRL 2505 / NI 9100) TaxID=479432 RepID=D2AYC6_STRRD|nr:zinc-binding dehydrogenase [Streptosporangium roseum]ACZ87136.1 NADPH:quinone reductase and related Zn-dependent oxidoreductase-like protein [Streptosporangium roseum DSM 43021]
MTPTSTLTDRYVETILRRLPDRQRPDIEKELRASIADAVDDRLDAGGDPAEAELAVLTELGDPERLAAGYADRPLQLIGPALYLDYVRLLTTLLATVVPAVAAAVGLVRGLQGAPALRVIGDPLEAALTAGVHIVFWTTLVFAIIERTAAPRRTSARSWTPAALPEPPSRRARYGELITQTVLLVLFTTFVLLSPVVSTETDAAGDPIGMLSPWLWETGIVYLFIALVVASLGFSFAKYYVRWSVPLAVAGSLVLIACAIALIWLAANGRVLNPAFVEAAGWPPSVPRWIATGLVVTSVGTLIHTVTVLVNGASGGVGTFTVQLARTLGAEVTGICSTRNAELVHSIGAHHVIDYTREDVTRGSGRFDVVIDLAGNHRLSEFRRVLTPKGVYVSSSSAGGVVLGPLPRLIAAAATSPFLSQRLRGLASRRSTEDLSLLAGLVAEGKVTPVIERTYPLNETADAIRLREAEHARGKIVLTA